MGVTSVLNILRRSPAQKPQAKAVGKSYSLGKWDALTGAANKSTFQKMVEDALAGEHTQGCLLLVDVDQQIRQISHIICDGINGALNL